MADANLAAALKQAKGKKMFFAFIPKGSDGKLMISKTKIKAKDLASARKESGGGAPVTGKCFGDGHVMAFEVTKAAPGTLAAALKKAAHRDAGMAIVPDVRLASHADADDDDTDTTATDQAAAPDGQAADDDAANDDAANDHAATKHAEHRHPEHEHAEHGHEHGHDHGHVLGIQKALQKLGFGLSRVDGVMSPDTHAAIKKFQQANGLPADGDLGHQTQVALAKALKGEAAGAGNGHAPAAAADLGPWHAAREHAIGELKTLAHKVAASKHPSAVGVIKEIQTIIGKLPAKPAPQDIDKLEELIQNDDAISAAEESPKHFHHMRIRKPLLEALQSLKK
jgi:hypothetical protein